MVYRDRIRSSNLNNEIPTGFSVNITVLLAMLTPTEDISHIPKHSHRTIQVVCSCGKNRNIEARKYFSGQETCGHCNDKGKDYWLAQTWGELKLDSTQQLPDEWSPNTHMKFRYLCSCGKSYISSPTKLLIGRAVTCGRCNDLSIADVLSMTWGKLRLDSKQTLPLFLSLKSNKKFYFLCECSKSTFQSMWAVSSGNNKTCGHCNDRGKDYWVSQRWGSLILNSLQPLPPTLSGGEGTRLLFHCDCGRNLSCSFKSVTNGNSSTCGRCSFKSKDYWLRQTWRRLKLDPNQPLPEEWAPWVTKKMYFICQCSPNKETRKKISFGQVAKDGQISCGCIRPGVSEFSPAGEILTFVQGLLSEGVSVEFSNRTVLQGKELDIFIPSLKIGIEYHGLMYHSDKFRQGTPDFDKFKLAKSLGIRVIQIYQDEWREKPDIVKRLLQEAISPVRGLLISPTFRVAPSCPPEASVFLNIYHLLGAVASGVTVVAEHKGEVVGVWVFDILTSGAVWTRFSWNSLYAPHPHSKVLDLVIKEFGVSKISVFSDNRFDTGGVYRDLGFTLDNEVPPTCYYTDFNDRRADCPDTKGWYRIWDSGGQMMVYSPVKRIHHQAQQRFSVTPDKAYQRHIADVCLEVEGGLVESLSGAVVAEITKEEAASIILKYEWLQTMPMGCICCYGLKAASGALLGVVGFSQVGGAPGSLCSSPKSNSVCLARGACTQNAPANSASFLIRRACKLAYAKYGWNIFFAYSDSTAGEIGTVYQASNWLYLGVSPGRPVNSYHVDYQSPDGSRLVTSHSINHDRAGTLASSLGCAVGVSLRKFLTQNGWTRIKREGKGKWVWFEGSRTLRRELLRTLRFPVVADGSFARPYPKRRLSVKV